MSHREGILRQQPTGRWAICREGWPPEELGVGAKFFIEVAGREQLAPATMRFHVGWHVEGDNGEPYFPRDGARAALGSD